MVRLSKFHRIELADEYQQMVDRPPLNDFSIRTISKKTANEQALIQTQLVIAGSKTRKAFPLADEYPVHFLKVYYPTSFHQDPRIEFENTRRAAAILDVPEPIGYDRNSIRTCFLPGVGYDRLSPLGAEPLRQNIETARTLPLAHQSGLWRLLEEVFETLDKLHAARFFHRDMELHNIIVSRSPLRPFLIDFESAAADFSGSAEEAETLRHADLLEVSRIAVYLQCAIGVQESGLGRYSIARLDEIFPEPDIFQSSLAGAGLYSP